MDNYSRALNMVLIDFQFIEEGLKMYISITDKIIKIQVNSYFPYMYKREDIDKFPLGKLLDRYSKISNNEALIKSVRRLMKKRNDLAHKGFLFTIEEVNDKLLLEKLTIDLKELHKKTKKIFIEIKDESTILEKYLNELKSSR